MYPITEEMKALFDKKQRQTVNIRAELKDGTTADDFNITEADIISNSFSLDRYCATGENIEIGSAVAAELKFTLDNSKGKFDNVYLGGAKLFVRLGIKDWSNADGDMNYMDCGYFTVDENPKPLTQISVAALDNMMRFDRAVNWEKFLFPMSVENIVSVCCANCDVTLSPDVVFAGLPNGSYTVQNKPSTADITYRQLIQWVAEITGTCAFIDWNGHLRFKWSEKTAAEINTSNRYSSATDDSITITGVQITESEDTVYLCGEEGFVFNIEGNELIQNNQSEIAANLGAVLCGFTYVPFECSCFPMPYLYPLDIVSFTDIKGNTFDTTVTAHVYTLNGTSSLQCAGESQQKKNYAVSNPFTKREALIIRKIKKEAETNMSRIEQETVDMNKALSNALGLYDTVVKHDDGSVTYYYHSKPNLEECAEGDVIFCLNSGGFGVCTTGWNDGEPVFENGLDAKSGKAIWQYLSAHKLSADLIEAGILSSLDGSIQFSLNEGKITTKSEGTTEIDQDSNEGTSRKVSSISSEAISFGKEFTLTDSEGNETTEYKGVSIGKNGIEINCGAADKYSFPKPDDWDNMNAFQKTAYKLGQMLLGAFHGITFKIGEQVTKIMATAIKSDAPYAIEAPEISLIGSIVPQVIPAGANFDDYTEFNSYVGDVSLGDGTTANYENSPSAVNAAFKFEVTPTGDSDQFMQKITLCSKGYGRKWERQYHSGSFGEWYCTYADRNNVLWSGESLMESTDVYITPTEKLSQQPTGIVFVFSPVGDETQNHNFVTHFVSKYEVLTHGGVGLLSRCSVLILSLWEPNICMYPIKK